MEQQCRVCGKSTDWQEIEHFHGVCSECDNRLNELTVNDIIRKVNERIKNILLFEDNVHNKFIKIDELKQLLNYIEKDEEY